MTAIAYEHPKLAVTANTDIGNFAAQLEEIARRSGRSMVIDAKPNRALPQAEPAVADPAGGFRRRL